MGSGPVVTVRDGILTHHSERVVEQGIHHVHMGHGSYVGPTIIKG